MNNEKMFPLALGKLNPGYIFADVKPDMKMLDSVFLGVSSSLPRVKFGCSKSLVFLSEADPEILYERFDNVAELLRSENRILRWNAITMIGNMAGIDRDHRIRDLLPSLYALLSCGELITANHAITALGKIGCAFPDKQKSVVLKLLAVEHQRFETSECRNIALGKVILALQLFVNHANAGRAVFSFVQRQTKNKRPATASKARSFLKKLAPE